MVPVLASSSTVRSEIKDPLLYDHLQPRPETRRKYDCFDSVCVDYCMANNAVLCMTEFTNSEYIDNAACPNLVSCMNASDVREGKFIDDEL